KSSSASEIVFCLTVFGARSSEQMIVLILLECLVQSANFLKPLKYVQTHEQWKSVHCRPILMTYWLRMRKSKIKGQEACHGRANASYGHDKQVRRELATTMSLLHTAVAVPAVGNWQFWLFFFHF
ncbi:hypothetical protein A2U01_0015703, partial [Trifolium medium]|nr:hypothetical protein [Trifolium medium]